MPKLDPFRVAFGGILVALFAVRAAGHMQMAQAREIEWHESKLNMTLRAIAGVVGFISLIVYLIKPAWLAWASVPLPDWTRWLGAAIGALGIALLGWVHNELGRNFSSTLHLRGEHTLVTSGPYRWVRNPMYTTLYMVVIAFFLVPANWLLGLLWFAGFTAVMISRVPKEEALMEQTFGDDYRAWATRTGRFLPRLR